MACDYPFGIFKIFLINGKLMKNNHWAVRFVNFNLYD
jgi:hypothetical protein